MEVNVSLSLLVSIAGIVASVASSIAIVKTKVAAMEDFRDEIKRETDSIRDSFTRYQADENVKIALLESQQATHSRELAELKGDIKTIMQNVQDIKEAVLRAKKGEA